MEEKILGTIITTFIKELIKEGKNIAGVAKDEAKQFLQIDLQSYLEKQRAKYSHVKTLLNGNTPVFLYNFYVHLRIENSDIVNDVKTNKVSNLFTDSNYITLIGDAGSGKSTLTKHLFLNSIFENYAVPILIELRYLNDFDGDLEGFIEEIIFENKISQNHNILERLLENGKFIFFLDGFDELNSDVRENVIKKINSYLNKYGNNKYILTSRPYSNIEHLPLFKNYEICQLNEDEIELFIRLQLKKETELADKIIESINDNKNLNFIQSFLTNPLLLSLYILTFQSNASIPAKKYIFYRRVINALFSEHDSKTKLGFVRERLTGLTQQNFEEVLKRFCFLSYFDFKFNFDTEYIFDRLDDIKKKLTNVDFDNSDFITDMISAVALWTEDNGLYSFAHRSLQEYFAASYIKKLRPEFQKKIFAKLIGKSSSNRRWNESKNLLVLCEEMSAITYYEYYLLPVLYMVKNRLEKGGKEKLSRNLLRLTYDRLRVSKNIGPHAYGPNYVNEEVFKHLNITEEFIIGLDRAIMDRSMKRKLTEEERKEVSKSERTLSLKKDFNLESIFNQELCSEITSIAEKLYEFITNKIIETENYIKHSDESDSDLIEMI